MDPTPLTNIAAPLMYMDKKRHQELGLALINKQKKNITPPSDKKSLFLILVFLSILKNYQVRCPFSYTNNLDLY